MESLLHNVEISMHTTSMAGTTFVAAGQKSPWVDFQNCEGCLFMMVGTSQVGSSKLTLRVIGSTISSSTTKAHVYSGDAISSSTGYGMAVTSVFNYKLAMVDLIKPKYRYNRLVVTGTTGIGGAFGNYRFVAIKHHMRARGSTTLWDSTSIGIGCSTVWVSPST